MDEVRSLETEISRIYFFSKPVVVFKIKLYDIIGDDNLDLKVDFLGLDRSTKQSIQHPFKGGSVFKSMF